MRPEGFAGADSGGRPLTRQEIMALDRAALADLLVKLCRADSGLDRLLSDLPARHAQPEDAAKPFAEPFMVGESLAMGRVFDAIRRFAQTDAPVLIQGESGTGKELAAQAIHERSAFATGPFVAINCGGLPASLIASELFGHEKGAFTGAHQRKIGKLEAAEGGTLMLDEVGDMPLELQPHLLRFLQEMTIERVGSNKPVRLNVRVIAATNRDLESEVRHRRFRHDLFHRLNCLALEIPPLRQRGEDIALLGGFFVRRFSSEIGQPEKRLGESALAALRGYAWPGNVRELISKIRRAVVMSDNRLLSAADLGLGPQDERPFWPAAAAAEPAAEPEERLRTADGLTLEAAKARLEEKLVREQLTRNAQNVTSAARDLGVSRVTLYRLIDKYQIRHRAAAGPS